MWTTCMCPTCFTRFLVCAIFGFGVCAGLFNSSGRAHAQDVLPTTLYTVGMKQLEYFDPSDHGRPLDLMLIYPAASATTAIPFHILLATNLHLYKDAPVVSDGLKHPLVMFSHGAGGNGSGYAWFGEYLASHGYIVAMAYHFRANAFDSSALYVRNRIWQRPRDISLDITSLLQDQVWGPHINPSQIGVAGHSQGGFTSLWIGAPKSIPSGFASTKASGRTTRLCRRIFGNK
jgi:predicted dienelactone hydrolase